MKKRTVLTIFIIAASIGIRLGCFDYETLDYLNFLRNWVAFFRQGGGFAALRNSVGNYNIPYLYFLALFSYIPVKDLYLIKGLSCLFDYLLAYSGMKIAEKCGASKKATLALFALILFLPTVVINSALWAQCDSIYVSLALFGIYLALDDRPVWSMIFMALSFGFKLQSVFILPVCVILLIMKKYRPWHFLLFPAAYFVLILPAVIAGRPLKDAVMLYLDQMNTVGSAPNYNAPSLNAITLGSGSVAAAFAAVAVIILLAVVIRKKLSSRVFFTLALITVTIIPFLLPHMHDRYFYASDVMSLVLVFCLGALGVFIKASGAIAAVCQEFASLVCYIAYLRTYYIRAGRIVLTNGSGAVAVLIALVIWTLIFLYLVTETGDRLSE